MKNKNILVVTVVIIIVLLISGIATYNNLITKKENVDNEASNLDVCLQRRVDLIPNLVNTVKGYTDHENKIIKQITQARIELVNANNINDKNAANEKISRLLNNLMINVENYPDLKASENFRQLSDELAGTENRIAVARRNYNEKVKQYNTLVNRFPTNIFAKSFGFEKEIYFTANESVNEVPKISFE